MEINIWIVLGILFFHWVFDFVLQKHKDAINKSISVKHLLNHTIDYSVYWLFVLLAYGCFTNNSTKDIIYNSLQFVGITFIIHTITDYFTSKLNKYLWDKKDSHNFFVSVGFDQFLHFVQLLLTYKLLIQ